MTITVESIAAGRCWSLHLIHRPKIEKEIELTGPGRDFLNLKANRAAHLQQICPSYPSQTASPTAD